MLLFLPLLGLLSLSPPVPAQHTKATAKKVVRQAPLVFIGRPLIGALHEDSVGCHCLYEVTYIDVVQVLRGELRPGKVELLDTFPGHVYRTNAGLRYMSRLGGTRGYAPGTLGIYFTQPAQPVRATRLQAAARPPVQVLGYELRPAAKIMLTPTATDPIEGLYRPWTSSQQVWKFLARQRGLRPVADSLQHRQTPVAAR